MLVIDGRDTILGRLASFVAKKLLEGESVTIVNAEHVVVSGKREKIIEIYRGWMQTRNIANPRKGPFHHRNPDALVRMAVRGMLPYDRHRGREAFRRLRVYTGIPEEMSGMETAHVPVAKIDSLGTRRYIRVGEISRFLGGKS
ncbi:MAG: 50S ribosomal protein L13 [Candidatus Hadarchaeales archaeon]